MVMQELLEPPTPGCVQYKLLEDETKTLRSLLKYHVKALARAKGISKIRKFESMDGTMKYFDYSDDTNSDDSIDGEDEEDNDEDDDTDGTEEDEKDEHEDDE